MKKNYGASINLAKLKAYRMTTKKGNDTLVIDLKSNHIKVDENGNCFLNLRVQTNTETDQYEQNGFIAHSAHKINGKTYKESSDEEKKAFDLPIIGNLKEFVSSEQPEDANKYGEDDDLPF